MRNFFLLVLVASCGPTSYQDAVAVYPGNSGRYVVEAKGNNRTDPGLLQSYIEQKAGELCPAGFDLVGGGDAASTTYVAAGNIAVPKTKHDITATIVCK